ncbi:MAG TPA: hypothetical protein VHB21_21485, partial [Minicystis sp.]|nr:hypothetical protein [Minicystis sp.]
MRSFGFSLWACVACGVVAAVAGACGAPFESAPGSAGGGGAGSTTTTTTTGAAGSTSASVSAGSGGSGGATSDCTKDGCDGGKYCNVDTKACASCASLDRFQFGLPKPLGVSTHAFTIFPRIAPSTGDLWISYASNLKSRIAVAPADASKNPPWAPFADA